MKEFIVVISRVLGSWLFEIAVKRLVRRVRMMLR